MKDIHSHLLPDIDDGTKSFEETLLLLKKMEKSGITELMLTPHYIENSEYVCNNQEKNKLYQELLKQVNTEKINIKLYLGNEIFFTNKVLELIKKKEIATLNKSKYLLIEFPMGTIYHNTPEIISTLTRKGYIPILAHPERYRIFQNHPEVIEDYLRMGLLLQGNFTSLFGKYGKVSEKTLKFFIKNKWISFLGSDTHHEVKYNEKRLKKKLLRLTKDKEYVENLLNNNFDKVVKNENIGILR